MKTPPIALLNSIGLSNEQQKALLAAHMLKAATVSSPAVTITPAVPPKAKVPAVIAQTAKPVRAATQPVAASANTTGFGFGELYLNSPAYPAGIGIPAIGAKPASNAVVGVPEIPAIVGVPAVIAPEIKAIPGWFDAISIAKSANGVQVVAYLPFKSAPALIGASTSGIDAINEITPASLQPLVWLDQKASLTPETIFSEPATLEGYLYKQALAIIGQPDSTSTIENTTKLIGANLVSCKKLTLNLFATDYTLGVDELQLSKIGYSSGGGGFGDGGGVSDT
jgi:hypothetical protein